MTKKFERKPRIVANGYRLIYKPDHPKSMTNSSHTGYVYEHIYLIEENLGRQLNETEIVHHLDNNPSNNRIENLLVINEDQHKKLHTWLDKLKSLEIDDSIYTFNREETLKNFKSNICEICGITLQQRQVNCCSIDCKSKYDKIHSKSSKKPSKEQLQEDMKTLPWTHIGSKYGVSDNAARKWAKSYGLETKKEYISIVKPKRKSKYKSEEERKEAKRKRHREKYNSMSLEEKQKRRKLNYEKYGV